MASSLRAIFSSEESNIYEANTGVRLAALEGLGHLLAMKSDFAWARELLIAQLRDAATHAERAAAATALARIAHPEAVAAVLDALADLPLDEPPVRETVYARAAVRLDAAGTERVLLTRLKRSIAARQSLEAEIDTLGRMRSKESLPLLLAAAGQSNVSSVDRHRIAWTLGRLDDDRAVPVLIGWLGRNDYELKAIALSALESLDSQVAAQEARPLLKSEAHLPYKLRIARVLARHGLADGYALATEHLSDEEHTAAAALVLAALKDPRTANDLSAIVAARPDRRWHAAALTGLAAIGDAAARKQLLEILADDRNPLAADAALATGLSSDSELVLPLAKLVQSRKSQIARASLLALRRYLSDVRLSPQGLAAVDGADTEIDDGQSLSAVADIPPERRAVIAEAVAALVIDAYVEAELRHEAFAVAKLLGGERYARLLSDLADQAELEGTPLLAAVQTERRRSQKLVNQP